jgi:hypothetical protein
VTHEEAEKALASVKRCGYAGTNSSPKEEIIYVSDAIFALEKLPSRDEAAESRSYFNDVEYFKALALKAEAELARVPASLRRAFVEGAEWGEGADSEADRRYPDAPKEMPIAQGNMLDHDIPATSSTQAQAATAWPVDTTQMRCEAAESRTASWRG